MFHPWHSTIMLTAEASQVVALRMMKMVWGGRAAQDESELMVREKVAACWEAATTLMTGGNGLTVIDRLREHVALNADRLTSR